MVFKYSYTVSSKESCKSASLKKSKSKAINSDDDNGIFILRKNIFLKVLPIFLEGKESPVVFRRGLRLRTHLRG